MNLEKFHCFHSSHELIYLYSAKMILDPLSTIAPKELEMARNCPIMLKNFSNCLRISDEKFSIQSENDDTQKVSGTHSHSLASKSSNRNENSSHINDFWETFSWSPICRTRAVGAFSVLFNQLTKRLRTSITRRRECHTWNTKSTALYLRISRPPMNCWIHWA